MIREYEINFSIITRFPQKYPEILWHESLEYNFPVGKTQQPIFKLKIEFCKMLVQVDELFCDCF